jgi:hypothetical protein
VRHLAVEHDCLACQTFLAAKRRVIPRQNSIDTHYMNDSIHDLVAECLETRAHQLDHRPAIVAIDNERRASIGLSVNDAVCIGHGLQPNPPAHRPLDTLPPPAGIDLDIGVGFDESE